jgi:hypothetical protein
MVCASRSRSSIAVACQPRNPPRLFKRLLPRPAGWRSSFLKHFPRAACPLSPRLVGDPSGRERPSADCPVRGVEDQSRSPSRRPGQLSGHRTITSNELVFGSARDSDRLVPLVGAACLDGVVLPGVDLVILDVQLLHPASATFARLAYTRTHRSAPGWRSSLLKRFPAPRVTFPGDLWRSLVVRPFSRAVRH